VSNYPAIADPTTDPASLREAVMALKETVEILTRQRGGGSAAAVTWAELEALGGSVLLDRLAELGSSISDSTETITTDYQAADQVLQDQLDAIVFANTAEAQAGTDATKYMNPARTKEAILALSPFVNFAYFEDRKTAGTNGGNGATSYTTRELNTVVQNSIAGCSLASNRVTLPAGTYIVEGSCPANRVNRHKCRLYNVTAASVIAYGTSEFGAVGSGNISITRSTVLARFVLSVTSDIRLEHNLENATNGADYGLASAMTGPEIYSFLKVWKLT
jgi:hypothetical protein